MVNNTVFTLERVDGPYDDEINSYDVIFLKNKVTLKEFIEAILADENEWGWLEFQTKDKLITIKYSYGQLISGKKYTWSNQYIDSVTAYNQYKDYMINDNLPVIAHGGLGCMDYSFVLQKR